MDITDSPRFVADMPADMYRLPPACGRAGGDLCGSGEGRAKAAQPARQSFSPSILDQEICDSELDGPDMSLGDSTRADLPRAHLDISPWKS